MARPAGPNDKSRFPSEPSLALEQFMNEYGTSILRTAYFYLGDRHLAEDVSQEVFLRAFRHWTSFRGESSVKTWLTKIAINACRDKLGLKMTQEQPTDPLLMESSVLRSVEEEAMERLDQTTILKYIAKLPVHYHEVIYLYYYLDLGTREIAEATGAPEGPFAEGFTGQESFLANTWQRRDSHNDIPGRPTSGPYKKRSG